MSADQSRHVRRKTSHGGYLRFARLRSEPESDSNQQVSLRWKVNPLRQRSSSLCHSPPVTRSRQRGNLQREQTISETIHRLLYGLAEKSMAGARWPARLEDSW